MSDDGYEYQYDDFGGILSDHEDEAPDLAEQVDSLAEHTHWSPVLVNSHPDFELEWDEWEYLTDEYYDAKDESVSQKEAVSKTEQSKPGKRKRGAADLNDVPEVHKRRRVIGLQETVTPLLVRWRKGSKDGDSNIPLIKPDDGIGVVLLPNWRDLVSADEETMHGELVEDPKFEASVVHGRQHLKITSTTTTSQPTSRKPGRLKEGQQKENMSNMAEKEKPLSNKLDSTTTKLSSKKKAKT